MARRVPTPTWREIDKRWMCRVQKDGKRRCFYSSTPGARGRNECRQKADKWLAEGGAVPDNPRVEDVLNAWLAEVKDTVGVTAYRTYEPISRHYIAPAIGKLRVDKLNNEQTLQKIINDAFKKGVGGKPLAKKTLTNIRAVITVFLRYCRKCGYPVVRPENLSIPKAAAGTTRKILQPEDLRVLFERATYDEQGDKPEWYIHAYRFEVLTGLRPGELIGLRWGDIREDVVRISRSINYLGEETPGKNANARRTFVLPERAAAVLADQRAQLAAAGLPTAGKAPVFADEDGEVTTQKQYRRRLVRYCSGNGITVVCPYELRHTWYSMNKELPAELVKAMGGHSESMDTFGVYGHDVDGDKERTARMMDEVAARILAGNGRE